MGIAIRPAGAQDLDAVAPLFDAYRQFYRGSPDLSAARAFLAERFQQGDSFIFLAFDGREPVGFTQLYPSFTSLGMKRIFILNDLFVTKSARRRGAGEALLKAAVEFGRAAGAARLMLETEVSNKTAQSLYERTGWKRDTDHYAYQFAL